MNYVGVDLGLNGAIALIQDGDVTLWDMPVFEVRKGIKTKRHYDIPAIKTIMAQFKAESSLICIEDGQAMPGQGSVSMMSIGRGLGTWEGLLTGMGLPYRLVHPKTWQKGVGFVTGNPKGQAYEIACRLYPHLKFKTKRGKIIDGRCDAVLIATYIKNTQCI